MSSNAAKKTILDSLYMLQRRKSILPIANCLVGSSGSSIIQNSHNSNIREHDVGNKKKWNKGLTSSGCDGNSTSAHHRRGGTPPLTTSRRASLHESNVPRVTVSSKAVPISRSPLLLRNDLFRVNGSNNIGVREHYDVALDDMDYHQHDHYCNESFTNNDMASASKNHGNSNRTVKYHHSSNNNNNNQNKKHINVKQETNSAKSNLVVVLDMDECIVHSQFLTITDDQENNYRQYESNRPSSHTFFNHYNNQEHESIIPSACESFRLCLEDGDQVHVNKRPNLDSFLKEVTSRFPTYVFTAALEVYAGPLLDKLDPDGTMFVGRFYREHCTYEPSLGAYIKDLNNIKLNRLHEDDEYNIDQENSNNNNEEQCRNDDLRTLFDDKRVVLIDNNPYSFLANPTNGILVSNFYDDPKDDTLQAVIELLDELDSVDDVRPILDAKFGLQDALEQVTKSQGYWK